MALAAPVVSGPTGPIGGGREAPEPGEEEPVHAIPAGETGAAGRSRLKWLGGWQGVLPSRRRMAVALLLGLFLTALLQHQPAGAMPALLVIRRVTVTNVSDTSFTVNWTTDVPLAGRGSVVFGTSTASVTVGIVEQGMVSGARGDVHSVTIRDLSPSTTYYVAVVDAGVTENNGGQYYQVTTGPSLTNPVLNRYATGQVLQADGRTPAAGVLVTLTVLDNAGLNGTSGPTTSAPLSALTDAQGTWRIPLNPRTTDNRNLFNYAVNGPDFVLVTVEGGGLGAIYPAQSFPLSADSTGKVAVPTLTLAATTIPTDTPVIATATFTATPIPTVTATATPTLTTVSTPTSTPTAVAPGPTVTPLARQTEIPLATPLVPAVTPPGPTVLPIPSRPSAPANQENPAITTVIPPPAPSGTLSPTPGGPAAEVQAPSAVAPAAGRTPRTVPPVTPSAAYALPTPAVGSPTALVLASTPGAAEPFRMVRGAVAGGVGLVGLGLVLALLGIVFQRRDG